MNDEAPQSVPEDTLNEIERIAHADIEKIMSAGRHHGAESERQRQDPLLITINAPHTVSVHGNSAAINIKSGPDAASSNSGSGTGALGPIVLTLSKNGIPTDYNINGEEA